MVSARRVGGRRLHELAREGIEVEREARPVTVHRFDVRPDAGPARLPHRGPVLVGDVHPDARRGSRAPARRRRAPAGPAPHGHRLVHRGRGRSPDAAELLPPAEALRDYERIVVDEDTAALIRHGRRLPAFAGPAAVGAPGGRRHPARGLRRASRWRRARRRPRRRLTGRQPLGRAGVSWCAASGRVRVACPSVQVINDLSQPPWPGERSVITIGAFDGVHLGHTAVVAQVRRLAAALDARSVVVTFDRHPASVVRPESAPRLLTDLPTRLELLARDRSRRHGRARLRPGPRRRVRPQLRRGGARQRAGHEGRRRRRRLPLRPPPRGQRRAAAGAGAGDGLRGRAGEPGRAPGRRRRARQLDGHPASAGRR